MGEKIIKEYSREGETVVWEPGLCIHSRHCVEKLPQVFKHKERPWVQMDQEGISIDEIVKTVRECPSGALSIKHDQSEGVGSEAAVRVSADVKSGGPIIFSGSFLIKYDGKVEKTKHRVSLCRCGVSLKKPFCDGGHKNITFD